MGTTGDITRGDTITDMVGIPRDTITGAIQDLMVDIQVDMERIRAKLGDFIFGGLQNWGNSGNI